jgi:hypothetical protein
MNSNYLSLVVTLTVENLLFPIELLICGIICHRVLLHVAQCIVLSTRLMVFWIVRGLYKSVMTFFPLPTGLSTSLCPVVVLIYQECAPALIFKTLCWGIEYMLGAWV